MTITTPLSSEPEHIPSPLEADVPPLAYATPEGLRPLPATSLRERIASIDGYRGLVMLLMMGEVLSFGRVSRNLPTSQFWAFLAHHQDHVRWIGCSLHDLIQPSFSFLVGVALPFSLARRANDGQPQWRRTLHAFWRALILVMLGVFLRSTGDSQNQTYWTFEDTLTQIGLGYGFLYVLALFTRRVQWIALAAILVGYWIAFAVFPLPGSGFNWKLAGMSPNAPELLNGFASHWGKNINLAWRFDVWFLNLFPRQSPFTNNGGGYATLSFIPTLGTMILGLLAGGVLQRDGSRWKKFGWLIAAGLIGLGAGWLLNYTRICPAVKRIWTPSWVLYSGGWCFLLLASFYLVMDMARLRLWAFWLTVVGVNSIAAYLIAHLFVEFFEVSIQKHFGMGWTRIAPAPYEPLIFGAAVLLIEWLILLWMYRRKIFLRI